MGKHGPLIPNPKGGTRRICDEVYGTVIRATEKGEWEVRFNFDGRRKNVKYNSLKVVDDKAGVPVHELETTAPSSTASAVSAQQVSTFSSTDTDTTDFTAIAHELVRTFILFSYFFRKNSNQSIFLRILFLILPFLTAS